MNERIIRLHTAALHFELIGSWYMAQLMRHWIDDEVTSARGQLLRKGSY